METYDRDLASRVWQRVYPQTPQQEPDGLTRLRRFLIDEQQTAECCAKLARQLPGSARTLNALASQCRKNALCLKGMCFLQEGSRPKAPKLPVREEKPETALRRCFADSLRWEKLCQEQQSDPEYGCIWEDLANKKREQSLEILQILGSLP